MQHISPHSPGLAGRGRASHGFATARRLGVALWLVLAGPAVAQEASRHGLPRKIATPYPLYADSGISWDGRVAIVSHPYGTWRAVALRATPTTMPTSSDGFPDFTNAVSPGIEFAPAADLNNGSMHPWDQTVTGLGMNAFGGCNLIPDPSWSAPLGTDSGNPFRSLADGTPHASGAYRTYRALVICDRPDYAWSGSKWQFVNMNSLPSKETGRVLLAITVNNPNTASAEVVNVSVVDRFAAFRIGTGPSSQPIRSLEPSITLDGHMICAQANKANDNGAGQIVCYVNQQPGALDGWSPAVWLHELYPFRWVMVGGQTVEQRYPIARQPLRDCSGVPFDTSLPYYGGYPWISWEGRFVMHTTYTAGVPDGHSDLTVTYQGQPYQVPGDRSNRGPVVAIGSFTGWQAWNLDGIANPNRHAWTARAYLPPAGEPYLVDSTTRLRIQVLGFAPGFWNMFGAVPSFPARPDQDFVFFPFVLNQHGYEEMSFKAWMDRDYAGYWNMNEMLHRPAAGSHLWTWDATRTPDTSGNGSVGTLHGAKFPCEYYGLGDPMAQSPRPSIASYANDRLWGKVGQAIYFPAGGHVRCAYTPGLDALDVSGELWVKAEVARPVDVDLLAQSGRFTLRVNSSGVPEVSLVLGGVTYTCSGGAPLNASQWYHLGFSWDDSGVVGVAGKLALYVDGYEVASIAPTGSLRRMGQDVIIGPRSSVGNKVLLIDQVAMSRVARPPSHFIAAAYRPLSAPIYSASLPQLPSGLPAVAAQVPVSSPYDPTIDALGHALFNDKGLSANGAIACATCHDPALGYTDGLPTSFGISGPLRRNSQSIVNRLFSSRQFWDQRVASLEEQAFLPILARDEMANTEPAVLAYLASDPNGVGYPTMFRSAFGSPAPTRARVEQALATFMRNVLRGGSAEDAYAAGNVNALTPAERHGRELFFGKGRCSGCHSGPNFTDERLWDTGLGLTSDRGAHEVTGLEKHRGAFKTPSLRNVAQTGPWFHDGSATSLADVVNHYNRGGVRQTLPSGQLLQSGALAPDVHRPLGLTANEVQDLVAYLNALTGFPLPSNH